MSYKKGECGNPKGRPKGSFNRIGARQREFLNNTLIDGTEKVAEILNKLQGVEYLKFYIALMQYAVPKPATVEVKDIPQLEAFIDMTKEERQEVIKEIQESIKNQNKST